MTDIYCSLHYNIGGEGITTEMPLSPRMALFNSLLLTLVVPFVVTDGSKMYIYVGG